MRKKFAKAFLLILLAAGMAALGGAAVYFFAPAKKVDFLLPVSGLSGESYGCETRLGAVLFPTFKSEKTDFEKVEAELVTGGSKIALEVEGDILNFLTSTSVEVGIIEPMEMTIFQNDQDYLVAVAYDPSATVFGTADVNIVMLNKNNGFATWSKSRTKSFVSDNPDSQVYYLTCL